MKQDRSLLVQNLIKPTLIVKRKRSVVKDIKSYLSEKHAIFDGSIQTWINNPADELREIDTRLLYLFAEQIFQKTGDLNINPEDFFTPAEIKTAKQYSGKMYIEDELTFPITFKNALQVSRDSWVFMMDIQTLVKLLKSRKLHWNPESQREATYKVVNGEIIEEATLIMPNVIEMKRLLKENRLERTQIILNCSLGTSDTDDEVIFNEDTHELTIQSGTKCDILDGFHRLKAVELALGENPNIEFEFEVKILNFTVDRAAQYLAQISKGTRMSEVKRRSMSRETNADIVVKELSEMSKLKNRISNKEGLLVSRKELVTYNNLVTSIEKNFDLDKKIDRIEIQNYLIEFFDILLEYYEEQFTTNYQESKKSSLLVDNNTFAGYVILAARMKKNNIDPINVKKFIDKIDFSKSNSLWKKLDVLDEKSRLTRNAKSGIEKLFSEIEV
jgi:hypothetical protein